MIRRLRLTGIAGRVFLYTAAIVGAVLIAALAIASHAARQASREAERRGVEQAADLTAQLLAGRERSLAGGARVFVQGPYFRALVAERRRDDILDQTFEAVDQLGAAWVFITDERGTLLAKSDEPGVRDVPLGGVPLVAGALEGRATSGYGVSRDSLLFQTVAVPIVVPGAAPVGVLVATKIVDRQTARDVRAATGADVVFYALDEHGVPHVAATSLAGRAEAAAALPAPAALTVSGHAAPRDVAHDARIGGTSYVSQGAAVTTAGGDVIGGFVVLRPEDSMAREVAGVRLSLLIAGLLGLALALAAAASAARRVTRPARALAAAAVQALDGDYEAASRAALRATARGPRDEIASLAGALAALLEELREKQALVALLDRSVAGSLQSAPEIAPADSEPGEATTPRRAVGARSRAVPLAMRPAAAPLAMRGVGALQPGAVFAERYVLREVLGSGGTGIVYRAADLTLNETIALKILRPELITDDHRAREELKHELRITRRVSHRNVVRTYDFGISGGIPFLTMEYVEGASLATVLAQRGALPRDVVLALARQLVRALEAAHEQGVLHGDLKPANVLVTIDGLLKVTDFGVARLMRRAPAARSPREAPVEPPHLAGAVVGTPEYMAPELLLGGVGDVRSDLYAAGVVLSECLTGTSPFQRDTPRAFFATKLEAPPERPKAAAVTAEGSTLEATIMWMTAPDPADRPASASAVGAMLGRIG